MLNGRYSYRFSGYSVTKDKGLTHHLLGVGFMNLANGVIAGEQQASVLDIEGSAQVVGSARFSLSGTYLVQTDANGDEIISSAAIVFTPPAGAGLDTTRDVFAFVSSGGGDRFWFISTKPELDTGNGAWTDAQDLVSGEAVRVN